MPFCCTKVCLEIKLRELKIGSERLYAIVLCFGFKYPEKTKNCIRSSLGIAYLRHLEVGFHSESTFRIKMHIASRQWHMGAHYPTTLHRALIQLSLTLPVFHQAPSRWSPYDQPETNFFFSFRSVSCTISLSEGLSDRFNSRFRIKYDFSRDWLP